ncbi:MAG: histidine ammonia-lyase [Candidatus Delongbacteria bacterium]|nr:histidine ammonia-lyase [Candidatus Delongbacteria bacterium]
MIYLDGNQLTIDQVIQIARDHEEVALDPEAIGRVHQSSGIVDQFIHENRIIYGITTGFGSFSQVKIPPENVRQLQANLLMSHSSGVGPSIPEEQVRAMMVLRVNALCKGYSGIRFETLERLLFFLNRNILPLVPKKGSVGASGDLVPLSHMSLPLIGLGQVIHQGRIMNARDMLQQIGMEPLVLEAKEGLALINGTQMMSAVGCLNVYDSLKLCRLADVISAASIEALRGTDTPFHPVVHQLRPHPGQQIVASNLRQLLQNSQIMHSHRNCSKIQDSYSLRCIPQVHGASRDAISFVASTLQTEINSVTDNPIILPEDHTSISCGNFHGQPVALAMDFLGIAVAELANISERRIERLVDPALSNLPPFLTPEGGLNSGYMITQYTAASLVSENKVLAHPASVDSIPTSANQEDHVSMGTIAAHKATEIIQNVQHVLAIELLCACQGLDFIAEKPGLGVHHIHQFIRKSIPTLTHDRIMADDIKHVTAIFSSSTLWKEISYVIPGLQ